MNTTILEINNLFKSYSKTSKDKNKNFDISNVVNVVNDISFYVCKGEIFCLLGNNGAGKTTTLRMIANLVKPDKGDIIIRGNKANKSDLSSNRHIGFLTSELKLDDFFTPEYLFTFFGKLYNMNKQEILARKQELFSVLGIEEFSNIQIKKLSTGMKQKVSIAISLVHNPEIIIFDEPTNGLDIVTSRDIVNFLIRLRDDGKCIVISTHIFDVVDKLANRVGIIIDGKMVCCTSYQELIVKGGSIENTFFGAYDKHKSCL